MMIDISHKIQKYLCQYPYKHFFSFDVTPYLSLIQFKAGDYIFRNNSEVKHLYYLVEGKAKLTIFESNGKAFIHIIQAPGFLGEIELIHAREFANEVRAYSSCTCFSLSLLDCREKLLTDAHFLRNLCSYMGRDSIRKLMTCTQNQAFTLERRLAKFILLMSHDNLYTEKHTEVSRYLGVSYRHLLYVIAEFCHSGLLAKETNCYRIIDPKKLEELTNPLS